ncbi:unnamed protein product [Clonostachys rosea]|uniref:Uncharacterized protein n=1 Tax=Bionectria ochroleuca TaxID=29856 RepID=A0ABY6U7R1_BIOOC|nr:unnamed protein product [Clonostachys rosea]
MSEFPQAQGLRTPDIEFEPTDAQKARRPWTDTEDQTLRHFVSQLGSARGRQSRWTDIARGLPGRTAKECRKRWFHSLDPSVRKGPWTQQEDRILLEGYARLGLAWSDICLLIPGRKDDQCSKRYNDILAPSAKDRLRGWSEEEDQVLRDSVQSLGHRWSAISALFPGRPPLTCRNRWRHLSTKQAMVSSDENDTSPSHAADTPQETLPDHDSGSLSSQTDLAYTPGPTPMHEVYGQHSIDEAQLSTFLQFEDIDAQPGFPGASVPSAEMAFDAMDYAITDMLSTEPETSYQARSHSTTAWDAPNEFDNKTHAASSPAASIGIASSLLSQYGQQYPQPDRAGIGD